MHPTLDPDTFLANLAPAMRRAASIARELEGRVANRPKHGEPSPVKAALTAADTEVQEALLEALLETGAPVSVEAEEDTPRVSSFAAEGEAKVVIDPIDGTLRFFLEALGPYSILLGLARDEVYVASHVALPREGIFVEAVRGGGARMAVGEAEPVPASASRDGHRVFISHDLPAAAVESLLAAGFEVAPASGGATAIAPLLPGVCGGLRHMPGGRVSIRSRVAALAAREAGARVCSSDGAAFPEAMHTAHASLLVAADAEVMEALCAAAQLAEERRT